MSIIVDLYGCKGNGTKEQAEEILLGALVPPPQDWYSFMGEYAQRKVYAQTVFRCLVTHKSVVRVEVEDQAGLTELHADFWFEVFCP